MKNFIYLSLFISTFSYAQTIDYTKFKKEELISIINNNDKEIKILKNNLKIENNKFKELDSTQKVINTNKDSIIHELKKSIKQTNAVFLRELFEDKYVAKPYLMETDLALEDISFRIENSNILINSILLDEENEKLFPICKKALNFNKNYSSLYEIRNNILSQKYDAFKVNNALEIIRNLPEIDENSKLNITKNKIVNLLKNYLENVCSLKHTLDAYKQADQTIIMKQKYSDLEKSDRYKDYPYLVKIILEIKNNVNDYTNDDLQPCEEENIKNNEGKSIINNEKELKNE